MNLLPFECTWKGDCVEIYQTSNDKKYYHGIYDVIPKDICEKCGNPYLVKIGDKPKCLESYLHSQIGDVDGTFQLGHYYKKNSLYEMREGDRLSHDILGLKKDADYAVPLAKSMYLAIRENFPLLLTADSIIPVPNHKEDFHSDAKAVALANQLQKEFHKGGKEIEVITPLQKISNVSTTGLGREDREFLVKNMFRFNPEYSVSKKKILLVDDVLTAGHIKGKCATILKENGADKVWIYVAGRTI